MSSRPRAWDVAAPALRGTRAPRRKLSADNRGGIAMAYFVTGGTGFIGRFLVADLLKRGEPIYVLVRRSSQKKLAALRKEWGASESQVIAVTGDLGKPLLGVADADIARLNGKVAHMFHL